MNSSIGHISQMFSNVTTFQKKYYLYFHIDFFNIFYFCLKSHSGPYLLYFVFKKYFITKKNISLFLHVFPTKNLRMFLVLQLFAFFIFQNLKCKIWTVSSLNCICISNFCRMQNTYWIKSY